MALQHHNSPIKIGNLALGLPNKILLQSMTSTPSLDTEATVEQIIRIVNAGADMVRIAAANTNEARNLSIIKTKLQQRSYHIPLIADIHFNPNAAIIAAAIVEKVRINPGNYMAKNRGQTHWTKKEYQNDLLEIKTRLKPLVEICQAHKTVIRIGVNYGSLSERIISKYGNTAEGMAESAMEFIHIFQELHFNNIVISLKASNVLVMVDSNQLLTEMMKKEKISYPLHLGVTEAGDGNDGRIKSAVGIGSLLCEGIGQTIRVSLTEEPEFEIPIAQSIIQFAAKNTIKKRISISYARKETYAVGNMGHKQSPIVIHNKKPNKPNLQADYIFDDITSTLSKCETIINEYSIEDLLNSSGNLKKAYFIRINPKTWTKDIARKLKHTKHLIIFLEKTSKTSLDSIHHLVKEIEAEQIACPLILHLHCSQRSKEKLMISASIQAASLLLASKLDGIFIDSSDFDTTEISFAILQATRQRISKTEYIACPSCGRTLFNIQEKLQEIKAKTAKYKNLKIGIMGCIVNGPGEMADADFGYVGSGHQKVDIYKAQQIIKRNVPEEEATQALLDVIEQYQT